MCAKSYRKSNFWRHYQHFFVSFLLFLSILSYLCNRKSLEKVAEQNKKSLEKRAQHQE